MSITLKQSIEITAQAMFNRAGPNAVDEALKQSMHLKKLVIMRGLMCGPRLPKLYPPIMPRKSAITLHQIHHNLV